MIVVIGSAPLSWEEEGLIGKASVLPGVLSEEKTAGASSPGGMRAFWMLAVSAAFSIQD